MRKLIYSIFLLSLWACNQSDSHPVADKDSSGKGSSTHSAYIFGEISEAELGSTVHLPAVLRPFEMVDIYPKVNGFIKEIPVDRGSRVRKGQLLLKLEAPEIEQQYMAAKAKYLQAYSLSLASKDDFDRLMVANKMPGTVSAHDLELAKAKMVADSATNQAEIANYKALEATRDYLTVTAPFDGVITERNVHPGALVGPNLKADDKAGSLNMKYRSEAIEVDVKNDNGLLKPGMYAEVDLPVQRATRSMVVPASAVVVSQEKKYVITVDGGKAHWVDVVTGNSRNDSTEVFGELSPRARIIVNANDEIRDGGAVQ